MSKHAASSEVEEEAVEFARLLTAIEGPPRDVVEFCARFDVSFCCGIERFSTKDTPYIAAIFAIDGRRSFSYSLAQAELALPRLFPHAREAQWRELVAEPPSPSASTSLSASTSPSAASSDAVVFVIRLNELYPLEADAKDTQDSLVAMVDASRNRVLGRASLVTGFPIKNILHCAEASANSAAVPRLFLNLTPAFSSNTPLAVAVDLNKRALSYIVVRTTLKFLFSQSML